MADKEILNVYANKALTRQFRKMAKHYGGRIGMCLSAAMLQFLETDPVVQADYLKRVFEAQLKEEMESLVAAVKEEQATRIANRENAEQGKKKRK